MRNKRQFARATVIKTSDNDYWDGATLRLQCWYFVCPSCCFREPSTWTSQDRTPGRPGRRSDQDDPHFSLLKSLENRSSKPRYVLRSRIACVPNLQQLMSSKGGLRKRTIHNPWAGLYHSWTAIGYYNYPLTYFRLSLAGLYE